MTPKELRNQLYDILCTSNDSCGLEIRKDNISNLDITVDDEKFIICVMHLHDYRWEP